MLAKCAKVKGVIKLLDWYSIPEGYLVVMERPYPCIDMFDFIKGEQKLDEEVGADIYLLSYFYIQMARFLFRQIVQTVHECAQRRVLHRDLKVFLLFIYHFFSEIFKLSRLFFQNNKKREDDLIFFAF